MEEVKHFEVKTRNGRTSCVIQCLAVRPETRARELTVVARLTFYVGKP